MTSNRRPENQVILNRNGLIAMFMTTNRLDFSDKIIIKTLIVRWITGAADES